MEKYGVIRENRSTWVNIHAGGLSQRARQHPLFREAITAGFRQAVDQLLGEGWHRPKDWGSLLLSFPEVDPKPWDVATSMFHWHMDPMQNIDRVRSLICFSFLSQVQWRTINLGNASRIAVGPDGLAGSRMPMAPSFG